MNCVLVDSNILLDLFTENPEWMPWSASRLETLAGENHLAINPIVFSEISYRFSRIEMLEEALGMAKLQRLPLPWEAAFLAAKCHAQYRARGGARAMTLPDFYIGAHAAVSGMALLTRDPARYRSYFPRLRLIHP